MMSISPCIYIQFYPGIWMIRLKAKLIEWVKLAVLARRVCLSIYKSWALQVTTKMRITRVQEQEIVEININDYNFFLFFLFFYKIIYFICIEGMVVTCRQVTSQGEGNIPNPSCALAQSTSSQPHSGLFFLRAIPVVGGMMIKLHCTSQPHLPIWLSPKRKTYSFLLFLVYMVESYHIKTQETVFLLS